MKLFLKLFITSFFVGLISYFVVTLHSWHMVEFKTHNVSVFKKVLKKNKKIGIIHFLTPACGCSSEVLDHLLAREPMNSDSTQELIVLLDDFSSFYSSKLEARNYKVFSFDSKSESEFVQTVKGVPLLVIFDQNYNSRYVGGYSDNLITPMTTINIKPIVSKIEKGIDAQALPVKGCAVSLEYKKILDPLGIKYAKN